MFLPDLQQHRLPQLDGEGLVLLVLFIIDDFHLDNLPVFGKKDPDESSVYWLVRLESMGNLS